jgi:NAD(P)-dependent dehydrogenase (short-subunit alcohol dehydrogenase family)
MTSSDNSPVADFPLLGRLDGRGMVVIGAGNGMGRQTAHALASVGARVFCVDNQPDLAREVAEEVGGIAWSGDARERADMERLVAESQRALGRVNGVVDIVGMARYGALVDIDDETWNWHHDIVLRHAFLTAQLFGRAMSATGGGSMAFVASVSGLTGAGSHAAYGVFKAGLMSLVRSAACELGPSGIRVNAVAPGVVWTPRVSALVGEAGKEQNASMVPLRRVALPADIAAALLFLSTDLSGFINGQTIVVDGGVSVKFPYEMPAQAR